jgi:outer membrane receptor protein involved in Fe transport
MPLRDECCVRASLLSLALLPVSASAQDIVVTGRGLADPASDPAYAVVEIGADRLGATASGRVEDALRDVAGLAQFRRSDARSANPTSQGVTLRGLGGNASGRVLVLLDGVPQGDPFAGYLNWPQYLPERLGQVRVTRGGGSGAGGSGALAGTIEFESVQAADSPGLAGSVAGGSFASAEARALVSARLGGGFALISGGYARSDGFVPIVAGQAGPADRAAPYEQMSLAARAVVPAGTSEVQALVALFDDRRSRGLAFTDNRTTGADASVRLVGARFTALGYLQLRKFASQFASVDTTRSVATATLDQFNTPATGIGARAEWRPDLGATELRLGGEWRRTMGETNELFFFQSGVPTRQRRAGGRNDIVGGFVEATRALGAITLTGGGRVDRWWIARGHRSERALTGATLSDVRFADRAAWETTGRAGAAWAASPGLTLRSAAYAGWRLPTLNELYRPFRVGIEQTNANAALLPERSRGGEIGIDWRPRDGIRIGITGYAMRLDDAIANVTLSASPAAVVRERANIDAIETRGVELDASLRAGDWRAIVSASLSDPRVKGGSLRPAQVARVQGSATVSWRGLALTARYTGEQYEDDLNTRVLGEALTIDAVAPLPLGGGFSLKLRGENIADARVAAAISAAGIVERAAPRTLWIGLSFGD